LNRKLSRLLLLLLAGALAFAADVNSLPKPTGYVSDLAHVVNAQDKEALEAFCTKVESDLGVQFALVTVDTVGDRPIRDFALDLFRGWGVGDRKTNQGVLLLLAIKDRQNDIETGRGIEPYLTDGFAGGTLRSMRPALRSSDYGAALLYGARAMASQIARGKNIDFTDTIPQMRQRAPENGANGGSHIPFPLVVVGLLFLLFFLSRGGGRGGGGGFLMGMLLGNLLGGGRRGGWGGGDWGGGGFGGGSGGGGGFGGFGGGDAGGGGASSNW
jgi:uncharacterized protein